ncbi:MAG: outer membrane beta-barrel protein [Rheinheimera sp.]|nr:outer membrane beta-barrel protein [Rheinheimera sp.]
MFRVWSKMLLIGVAVLASQAHAATNFYAVAGAQYSRSGEPFDVSGAGYQIGSGYVINRDWSVEINAEQLFATKKDNEIGQSRLNSGAVTLSVLGKTSLGVDGLFFYRAGISNVDHQGYYHFVASKKTLPDGSSKTTIGYNEVDDKLTHALFGFGLEQNFSMQWFGRAEIVHLFKKNNSQADTFRLSLGYRF